MAADKEQVKPLAPASHRINVDEDHPIPMDLKIHRRHQKYIICCGCITAVLLILFVMILLIFTVFRIRDPVMKIKSMKIEGLDGLNLTGPIPGTNLTVFADVSVKNPNVASFKFHQVKTILYYDGEIIGEAYTPPGHARARRTLQMNVSLNVMIDKVLTIPRLGSDINSGTLPVSSYTSVNGRVKILNIIKKNYVVNLNCSMIVNVANQEVQDQNCKRQVLH